MGAYLDYQNRITAVCQKYARKPAFVCMAEDGALREQTFGALYQTILAFKETMDRCHLKAGDRVIILDNHTPSVLRTFLCATYWNLTACMVDVGLPAEEIAYFIDFLDVRAIFTNTAVGKRLPEEVRRRLPILDLRAADAACPDISGYWPKEPLPATPDPDTDVIAVILSSGTTSRMKAVQVTYESALLSVQVTKDLIGYGADTDVLLVFPLFHISGLTVALMAFTNGITSKMVDTFAPATLQNALQAYRPKAFGMVPKVFEVMVQRLQQELAAKPAWVRRYYRLAFRVSSFFNRRFGLRGVGRLLLHPFAKALFGGKMEYLGVGAAPCDALTAETMINMGLVWAFIYASTETGVPITATSRADHYATDNVGRVDSNPYVQILIHQPDLRGVGEIYVKTRLIMKGYFREPELTQAAFDNGYFKTGDLGYIDREGYLHITGRIKEAILLHTGKKVAPSDLENILLPVCRDTCELAVCGVTDPDSGFDQIHVFLEDPGLAPEQQEQLAALVLAKGRQDAPLYPIAQVHFIDRIPKTSVGKVKRYLLKEQVRQHADSSAPVSTAAGAKKAAAQSAQPLAARAAVLETLSAYVSPERTIRDSDHLEDLMGLDSLLVFELCSAIEDKAQVLLGTDIITVKTVEDLIRLVEQKQRKAHRKGA